MAEARFFPSCIPIPLGGSDHDGEHAARVPVTSAHEALIAILLRPMAVSDRQVKDI